MKKNILLVGLALAATTTLAAADGRKPGSVLVYPVQRSGAQQFASGVGQPAQVMPYYTLVAVTNTNPSPTGGATDIHIEYVNAVPDPAQPFKPLHCQVIDRIEHLTPADTRAFLTNCQNPGPMHEGYLVITALDPSAFSKPWSHDYLVGSEVVVNGMGTMYELNAIPFDSPQAPGAATDLDGDGELDFDGIEYEGVPDELYFDSFFPELHPSLALVNLTGGTAFEAVIGFTVFNDNEFPLSATLTFRCWFDQPLQDISLVFDETFLGQNTPDDPTETDIDCDFVGDMESGWARIDGIVANSSAESIADPALLGAVTAPDSPMFNMGGGRLLWESVALQANGDFLKFGVDDPEH